MQKDYDHKHLINFDLEFYIFDKQFENYIPEEILEKHY